MKIRMPWCVAAVVALMPLALLSAAPVKPAGPMNITGTIESLEWVPKQFVTARIPGASGTLGVDRTLASRFKVVLKDYTGLTEDNVKELVRFYNGGFPGNPPGHPSPRIHITILSDNPKLLAVGMKIQVTGYTIAGDEGGDWEHCDKLEILEPAKTK
jgi:hypothetical protein